MQKILLIQPILSHYRESLFELLTSDTKCNFHIIAGKELNDVNVFESKSDKIQASLKNYTVSFMGHKFYYQKGIYNEIKEFKPTNIILGGPDFHFISTVFVSLYLFFFTKIKVHYWTHGISNTNSKIFLGLLGYFYKKASTILTYEQNGKDEIISKMKVDKNKIYVVKNCLNLWDYGFENDRGHLTKGFSKLNILFSGRLTKKKRVDILIDSIKILFEKKIQVSVIIIGDGEYKIELEQLTDKYGMNKIIKFMGALYEHEVEKYFTSSDVFVLPGKVGLSVIHALSYGIPVITTNLPIHSPEANILRQDENAFFFKGESPRELAKTLLEFYYSYKNDNLNLRKNCIESVLKNGYTPHEMKKNILNAIDNFQG